MINIIYVLLFLFLTKTGGDAGINVSEIVRIMGGRPTSINDFPYLISLRAFNEHKCGGSILTVNHVLTAAHCTYGYEEYHLSVKAGSSYRTKSDGQLVEVGRIYQHPHYDPFTYNADISMLRLATSLVLGPGVATINMIDAGKEIPDGSLCVTVGWGKINGTLADQLQVVEVTAISSEKCKTYFNQEVDTITEGMVCAGNEEGQRGICNGDSGGPLVLNGLLVGVTSWGSHSCAAANAPGVFAKLSVYREYIDRAVALG